MTVPRITAVELTPAGSGPLLLVGPSLGTSVEALWSGVASRLAQDFHVVGWDLPGHGRSAPATEPFTMDELAAGVLAVADSLVGPTGAFSYAGDSIGGAIGLQLAIDAPERLDAAIVLCTGARIGTPEAWRERAERVRGSGTPVMVESSAARWFSPGFLERQPATGTRLLQSLQDADAESYALACEALAEYDLRDRLGEVDTPVLAVAGLDDLPTPPESLREIAVGATRGRLAVLEAVGHLAPAEAPEEVSVLVRDHVARATARTVKDVRDAGMVTRREVLGDAHVDRATAAVTPLTADFQDLITQYAWGSIWTRPGLNRRSRSLITLTALVALGHHEELEMHVRAARTNGLTNDELKELFLQTAIYCGVPAANTALRIAQEVLADLDGH